MEERTKTCTKCNVDKPLSGFNRSSRVADGRRSRCRECDAAYNSERYRRDPSKVRATVQAWERANPEKAKAVYREGCRRWRAKNPTAPAEYMRARWAADPEGMKEASRRWATENPEKNRAKSRKYSRTHKPWRRPERKAQAAKWRRANREKCAESLRRYRSRKKTSIVVRFTLEQLAERMSMFSGCWMCGGEWTEIDHMKPVSKGGAHCLSNIFPACRSCNASKSDSWWGPIETIRRLRYVEVVAA